MDGSLPTRRTGCRSPRPTRSNLAGPSASGRRPNRGQGCPCRWPAEIWNTPDPESVGGSRAGRARRRPTSVGSDGVGGGGSRRRRWSVPRAARGVGSRRDRARARAAPSAGTATTAGRGSTGIGDLTSRPAGAIRREAAMMFGSTGPGSAWNGVWSRSLAAGEPPPVAGSGAAAAGAARPRGRRGIVGRMWHRAWHRRVQGHRRCKGIVGSEGARPEPALAPAAALIALFAKGTPGTARTAENPLPLRYD